MFFSRTKRPMTWKLVCSIGCSSTTKFVQMMTLSWPWPILRQGQIWFLVLLYGKTVNGFFINCCSLWFETSNRWPKWQEISVGIKTLSPGGCMPLPRGYIYVLNHGKNCIKSDFKEISLKLATNGWSDKAFLSTSKFCPLGAVYPCPWAIYMY